MLPRTSRSCSLVGAEESVQHLLADEAVRGGLDPGDQPLALVGVEGGPASRCGRARG